MRQETQTSIGAWAERVFGPAGSNARTAIRANEGDENEVTCSACRAIVARAEA